MGDIDTHTLSRYAAPLSVHPLLARAPCLPLSGVPTALFGRAEYLIDSSISTTAAPELQGQEQCCNRTNDNRCPHPHPRLRSSSLPLLCHATAHPQLANETWRWWHDRRTLSLAPISHQ